MEYVDPDLISSISNVESNNNPNARGADGEYGLMQIMPKNWEYYNGGPDPFDPEENVRVGTALISDELKTFNGDIALATAAYNAGSPAVRRAIEKAGSTDFERVAPYLPKGVNKAGASYDTAGYVEKVLGNYNKIKEGRLDSSATRYKEQQNGSSPDNSVIITNSAAGSNGQSYADSWGGPKDFALEIEDLYTSEGIDDMSATDKFQAISRIYDSKNWTPETTEVLKQVGDDIRSSYPEREIPSLRSLAAPYLASIAGGDEKDLIASAEEQKKAYTKQSLISGFNPYLLGSQIDEYFDEALQQKIQENTVAKRKGTFFSGALAGTAREMAKGVVSGLVTSPAAGVLSAAGYEEKAESFRIFPEEFLGGTPEFYFQTNDDGSIAYDEDGLPIQIDTFAGQTAQGVGNVLALLGTGRALMALGYSKSALALFGGVNGLNSMDQAYVLAREAGASKQDAQTASLLALPPSLAATASDIVITGTNAFWAKAINNPVTRTRATVILAARGAAFGAAGNLAEQVGIEYAASGVVGEEIEGSAERYKIAGVTGGVAGAVFGGVEGLSQQPKYREYAEAKQKINEEFARQQEFQAQESAAQGKVDASVQNRIRGIESQQIAKRREGYPVIEVGAPSRYGSQEPILVKPEVDAETAIRVVEKLEGFEQTMGDRLVVDIDSTKTIPKTITDLFEVDAEILNGKQVAFIKRQSYVPPESTLIDDVQAKVDDLTYELETSPKLEELPFLYHKRDIAQIKLKGSEIIASREVDNAINENISYRRKIESHRKSKRTKKLSTKKLNQAAIKSLLTKIEGNKLIIAEGGGEKYAVLKEKVIDVTGTIRQLENPQYTNNLKAKERELAGYVEQAELLKTQQKDTAKKTSDVADAPDIMATIDTAKGVRALIPYDGKWYGVDPKTGKVLTNGDYYVKDAITKLRQVESTTTPKIEAVTKQDVFTRTDAIKEKVQSPKQRKQEFKDKKSAIGKIGEEPTGKKSVEGEEVVSDRVTDKESATTQKQVDTLVDKIIKSDSGNEKKLTNLAKKVRTLVESTTVKNAEKLDIDALKTQWDELVEGQYAEGPFPTLGKALSRKIDPITKLPDVDDADKITTLKETTKEKSTRQQTIVDQARDRTRQLAASEPDVVSGTRKVDVDPIFNDGKGIKNPEQLQKASAKLFKKAIKFGGVSGNTLGAYVPRFAKTFVRFKGDLSTTLHELLHATDDVLKLGKFSKLLEEGKNKALPMVNELMELAPGGSGGPDKSFQYNLAEGAAEYGRGWMVNPDYMERKFPAFTEYFMKNVPEDLLIGMRRLGDEVREYHGAPAIAKFESIISMEPDSTLDRTVKGLRNLAYPGETGKFNVSAWDKFARRWTDSSKIRNKAIKWARELGGKGEQLPSDDPEILARLHLGVGSKVESFFVNGQRNARGEKISKSFAKEILDPLDNSSPKSLDNEMSLTAAYMVAGKTAEKSTQQQLRQAGQAIRKLGPISGVAGGPNVISKGMTDAQVAKQFFKEFGNLPADQQSRVKKSADAYRKWADNNLRYMVDKGRISQKDYEYIKSRNVEYVAMQRIQDDGIDGMFTGSSKDLLNSINALPVFKGSGGTIRNPFENLLDSTFRTVKEADRNNVMIKFTDLMDNARSMYEGTPAEMGILGHKLEGGIVADPKKSIVVYKNGEKQYWEFDPEIKLAFEGYGESAIGTIVNVLEKPANLLRFGISYSPSFAVRNYLRDAQERFILSDSSTVAQAEALIHSFGLTLSPKDLSMAINDLKSFGGDQAGFYLRDRIDYHRALSTAMREVAGSKKSILWIPQKTWRGYKSVVESSEVLGRIVEYKAAYKKAKNDFKYDDYNASLYAAYKARDIMDFAVAGTVMREINRIIPYSNATVQGVRRAVKSAKQSPVGFATKTMIFSILPTYLAREFNNDMGANEEYEKLPFWRRDMFYNLKIGDDSWLSIPKPFSTVIASAAFDRYISQVNGEKDMFKGFIGAASKEIFPFGGELFTPVFKPTAEVFLNRDLFRMKTIVPPYEERLELGKRTSSQKSSRIGNAVQDLTIASGLGDNFLAKRLLNARAVDHQVEGYLGNLGGVVINASDYGRENRRGLRVGSDIVGLVKGSPVYGSKDVEFIYDYTANKGISTLSVKLKPLKRAMDDYFDAKTPAEKQNKGDKVLEVAEKIRNGIEEKGESYFGKKKKKKKKK